MNPQPFTPPEHVALEIGARRAALRVCGQKVSAFDVVRVDVVTRSQAEELSARAQSATASVLVVFERSSPEARALFRQRGVSYAAADGELFVLAPPVYVERPARSRSLRDAGAPQTAPFGIRASRAARWLLLHLGERPTIRQLAREVELSEAMVSRTVRALAEDGLLVVDSDPDDARLRRARLRDPRRLLDAFEKSAAARRHRRITWNIGSRDVPSALAALGEAATHLKRPYAVGGLVAATFIRRVVEPSELSVWIARDDLDLWATELVAAHAKPAPGRVTVHIAPDPFVLSLAKEYDGICVADPVQIYLDCRVAGERALEAAEAVRADMHW